MLVQSPQSRREFIMSLELAAPQQPSPARSEGLPVAQSGPAAFVEAGSIKSFVAEVPSQMAEDVLCSSLLAQVAASAKHNRWTDFAGWCDYCGNIMQTLGWILESVRFKKQTLSGTIRLDKITVGLLRSIVSRHELEALENALRATGEKPENERAMKLFCNQATSTKAAAFQLGSVTADPNGNASMAFGMYHVGGLKRRERFLWVDLKGPLDVSSSVQRAVLNEKLYSQVREEVKKKLVDRIKDFIFEIKP